MAGFDDFDAEFVGEIEYVDNSNEYSGEFVGEIFYTPVFTTTESVNLAAIFSGIGFKIFVDSTELELIKKADIVKDGNQDTAGNFSFIVGNPDNTIASTVVVGGHLECYLYVSGAWEKFFGGYLTNVDNVSARGRFITASGGDYSEAFKRRTTDAVANQTYAATEVGAVFDDIVDVFTGAPFSFTKNIANTAYTAEIIQFNGESCHQASSKLATLTNHRWWVTPAKVVNLQPLGSLTSSGKTLTRAQSSSNNVIWIKRNTDRERLCNKAIVRGKAHTYTETDASSVSDNGVYAKTIYNSQLMTAADVQQYAEQYVVYFKGDPSDSHQLFYYQARIRPIADLDIHKTVAVTYADYGLSATTLEITRMQYVFEGGKFYIDLTLKMPFPSALHLIGETSIRAAQTEDSSPEALFEMVPTTESENCSGSSYPLDLRVKVHTNTKKVQHMWLSYKVEPYRAYAGTSAAGAAHGHSFTAQTSDVSAAAQRVVTDALSNSSSSTGLTINGSGGAWVTIATISSAEFTTGIEELEIFANLKLASGEGTARNIRVRAYADDGGSRNYYPDESAGKTMHLAVNTQFSETGMAITVPRARTAGGNNQILVQGRSADVNSFDIDYNVHWAGSNKHTHTLSGVTADNESTHTHGSTYGISESGGTIGDIAIKIDTVDKTSELETSLGTTLSITSETDIDLVEHISSITWDTWTGWHLIELIPTGGADSGKCRIWAHVDAQLYINPAY